MGAVRFNLDQEITTLAPNDDEYVGPFPLGFDFFGYKSCYVNNNGSISFEWGSRDYHPDVLHTDVISPSVVAYWTDVDTRDDPLGKAYVKYGTAHLDGVPVFLCTWFEVGMYSINYTLRGTFQIILSYNRIEINYDKIELSVGSANRFDPPRAGIVLPAVLGPTPAWVYETAYGNISTNQPKVMILTMGHATEGSYVLWSPGMAVPSSVISFDATAAQVRTALEASSIGSNVGVIGEVGGPFTISIDVAGLGHYMNTLWVSSPGPVYQGSNTLRNTDPMEGAADLALVLDPLTVSIDNPGTPNSAYEFPGSGSGSTTTNGNILTLDGLVTFLMTDGNTHALIASSRGTNVLGRYIFGFTGAPNLAGDLLDDRVRFWGK